MNINDAFPSSYLKAADLQGRDVVVEIQKIETEEIGSDHKPVIYFSGKERGLVLNKTNAMTIASEFGPETNGWMGKRIILYSAMVDFQGRSVEAIRVRPHRDVVQEMPDPAMQAPHDGPPF